MNPNDERVIKALATIYDGNWQDGLTQFAERKKEDALAVLVSADPTNVSAIASAQAKYRAWDSEVPAIIEAFKDFAQQQNAQKPGA